MENQQSIYGEQIEQLKDYAFFFIDTDGFLRTWNAGVEHLLGYTAAEWLDQHAAMIFTPEDQAVSLAESEMRVAREQGSASDIRWHKRKDGSDIFANGVLSAVYAPTGELRGYTKIIADETDRKRLEDSLVQANAALEHFAYAASHDLQEPLRTIGSFAQLLVKQQGDQLSPRGRDYLAFITGAVSRMGTLIDDLLAYARAGVEPEPVVSVSLDQEAESAISQLAAAIAETSAIITHDPLPVVPARHTQITRLFLNLIGNAIKYRAADRVPAIHIASVEDAQWTTISVADNGVGFAPEYAAKIFEPFARLHGKEYSGSGVGLTICRRIVERWGGRIWAESKPGEGSTFSFTLPRTPDA
jgi:PAS domain S-box-containing protein